MPRFRFTVRRMMVVVAIVGTTCLGLLWALSPLRPTGKITKGQALRIAQADAATVYHDLSVYTVIAEYRSDGWHIDYELTNKFSDGGGPHYVIDGEDGVILARRYEQ